VANEFLQTFSKHLVVFDQKDVLAAPLGKRTLVPIFIAGGRHRSISRLLVLALLTQGTQAIGNGQTYLQLSCVDLDNNGLDPVANKQLPRDW